VNLRFLNNLLGHAIVPSPRDVDTVITTSTPPEPPNWDQSCNRAILSKDQFIKLRVEPFTPEYRTLADLIHSAPDLEVTGIQRVVNIHLWKKFLTARDELLSSKSDDVGLLRELGLSDSEIQHQSQSCANFNATSKGIPSYSDNVALLLHCTRRSVDTILSEGLDERLAKDTGLLGRGIYFSGKINLILWYRKYSRAPSFNQYKV